MSARMQMNLCGLPVGRIALHLLALAKDGHFKWHLSGIARELRK